MVRPRPRLQFHFHFRVSCRRRGFSLTAWRARTGTRTHRFQPRWVRLSSLSSSTSLYVSIYHFRCFRPDVPCSCSDSCTHQKWPPVDPLGALMALKVLLWWPRPDRPLMVGPPHLLEFVRIISTAIKDGSHFPLTMLKNTALYYISCIKQQLKKNKRVCLGG